MRTQWESAIPLFPPKVFHKSRIPIDFPPQSRISLHAVGPVNRRFRPKQEIRSCLGLLRSVLIHERAYGAVYRSLSILWKLLRSAVFGVAAIATRSLQLCACVRDFTSSWICTKRNKPNWSLQTGQISRVSTLDSLIPVSCWQEWFNAAPFSLQFPASRTSKKPNSASRKTYWGPSTIC